jgi:hypothetical protein
MPRPAPRAEPRIPWTAEERRALDALDSPPAIQAFLDAIPYSADPVYRSPRSVLRDRKAHCFDGAMLAGAALRRQGEAALLVNLRAVRDDDHVITIFRRHGRVGAIAKSNVVGLRYREPIFRSVRELVLSYFEDYFNTLGEKTLRAYSVPVDLRRWDAESWWFRDEAMELIAAGLDGARHGIIAPLPVIAGLEKVDARRFEAGLLGADAAGLYDAAKKG